VGPRPALASAYTPDRATSMSDWLALRLRLRRGFRPEEFEARFGVPLAGVCGTVLEECAEAGVLETSGVARLTSAGRLLHGEVVARLTVAIRAAV